ncbi:hypothetical protein OROHE_008708 [Orobanche hederae]
MSEVKDPKIKLFGKTIELQENATAAAATADDEAGEPGSAQSRGPAVGDPACSSDSTLEDSIFLSGDAEKHESIKVPQEQKTVEAIVKASEYPLSIIVVGVGDGPWGVMHGFDDNIPARAFDNIQFVNFIEIMSRNVLLPHKAAEFSLAALMDIPLQYRATLELHLLGNQRGISTKVPLPPPTPNLRSPLFSRASSFTRNFRPSCPPPPPSPSETYSTNRMILRGARSVSGTDEISRLDVAISVVLLICVTKVAKSAFDKALAEHEDIDDAVGSE